jgi:hypothetical protein
MTDRIDSLEARMVAIEMFVRAMLTGMISRAVDPLGELDRLADDFRVSTGFLQITGGAGDDHSERMRDLIRARGDENFDAIRSRLYRDLEIEAARASKN